MTRIYWLVAIAMFLGLVVGLIACVASGGGSGSSKSPDDDNGDDDDSALSWSAMTLPTGTKANLAGVWGSSASDVFAVGSDSVTNASAILHYDGSGWSAMPTGTTDDVWLCPMAALWQSTWHNATHANSTEK